MDRRYQIEARAIHDPGGHINGPGFIPETTVTVIKVTWANGRSFTRHIHGGQPAVVAWGIEVTMRRFGNMALGIALLLAVVGGLKSDPTLVLFAALVTAVFVVTFWLDKRVMDTHTDTEREQVQCLAQGLSSALALDPDNTEIMASARHFMTALEQRDTRMVVAMAQEFDAAISANGQVPGIESSTDFEQYGDREVGNAVVLDAAEMLRAHGQADNATLVDDVAERYDRLAPDRQVIADAAARTISEAFTTLTGIPDYLATRPGPDGTTPVDDADASVNAAVQMLRTLGEDTYQDDMDQLRALRRYATQWDASETALHLD